MAGGDASSTTQMSELSKFPPVRPLILDPGADGATDSHAGVLEGGGAGVVVHEVLGVVSSVPLLPSRREGQVAGFLYLDTGIFPLSCSGEKVVL